MQYEHALLQPSITDRNAVHSDDVGCGILSNFSISGNDTSTTRGLPERTCDDELRQAVQRLRAEHDVDERRALQDRGALLARDAAADADDEVRVRFLELAPAAEQREHLLLRLLAHGAGVDQHDVGLLGDVGRLAR